MPGVPGTRGISMGESKPALLWISKSDPAAGMLRSVSSDKGVYAVTWRGSVRKTRYRRESNG